MVPLLLRVLKTKLKEAVISGEEKREAVRLYSKQHYNSSNSTCTEFRLQCLVQFLHRGRGNPRITNALALNTQQSL